MEPGKEEARPPMRCGVCQEKIPEGTGHYRLVESRVHIGCMKSPWRQPPATPLGQRIRDKIDARQLPFLAPEKMYTGYGKGHPCSGCDEPIRPAQVEYAGEIDGQAIRFHIGVTVYGRRNAGGAAGARPTRRTAREMFGKAFEVVRRQPDDSWRFAIDDPSARE